ncbi:MAG: GvpL/GvpF family gas vesicle protein [Candidatus Rokubacteria bacterium]|nr:GvpL/GvpF family gas vesicle protein [Candidatus Rokubacteria bacterium]
MASHDYLYAIVDGLPRRWRPPAAGVGGGPVVARAIGDLTLIVTPLAVPPGRTPGALAVHQDVVATLLESRAVVPLRFGALVAAADLDRWLSLHLARVRAALAELRGAVEMTVRLLPLDLRAAAPAAAGQLVALATRLIERAGLPGWRYVPTGGARHACASLAFLVPRDDVPGFLVRIAPVASHAEGVAVVPSGPWPPYSFAPALDPGAGASAALAG